MTVTSEQANPIAQVLREHPQDLLEQWIQVQMDAPWVRLDLIGEAEIRAQSAELIELLGAACQSGNVSDIQADEWGRVRDFLRELSRSRATLGFSPTETAQFVLSFKMPLINMLRQASPSLDMQVWQTMWQASVLVDDLALYLLDVYMTSREQVIKRQQMELMELSTPVVQVWEGILVLPIIGTLDTARTQVVMENLLQAIVETASDIAIIDITGVPMVDTSVAQHLIKTVTAARLMGARCIVSGIRPQIAQTMVNLGVTFADITTRASLADALAYAFAQLNMRVTRNESS
ncbi:MAG: STAS domain-containing protein [Caldilineae bacterium]|nr:MAG: STAS domain-containing protein [Caldilineae bacterium]